MEEQHSKLYNYFVSCWRFNSSFTEQNLTNAVTKGYITEAEKAEILAIPRELSISQ